MQKCLPFPKKRAKKSTFFYQKTRVNVHFLPKSTPPKSRPGYGPGYKLYTIVYDTVFTLPFTNTKYLSQICDITCLPFSFFKFDTSAVSKDRYLVFQAWGHISGLSILSFLPLDLGSVLGAAMLDGGFILASDAIHLITMVSACLLGLT